MQGEPASIDLVISLEVDVSPVKFKMANYWITDDEAFLIVDCEFDSLVSQLLNAHVGKWKVKVLVEDWVVSLFFDLRSMESYLCSFGLIFYLDLDESVCCCFFSIEQDEVDVPGHEVVGFVDSYEHFVIALAHLVALNELE